MRSATRTVRALFLVGTVVAAGPSAGVLLGPTLSVSWVHLGSAGTPPDRLIAAVVALLAAATLTICWLWALATVVACTVDVWSGSRTPGVPRQDSLLRPRLVRLAVSAAVGSVVVAAPSQGEPPPAPPVDLNGLSLPDRAVGTVHRSLSSEDPSTREGRVHRVRSGDSLWVIAERLLPSRSSAGEVDAAWRALYRANRLVVGPDPSLIHPDAVLRVPRSVRLPLTSPGDRS